MEIMNNAAQSSHSGCAIKLQSSSTVFYIKGAVKAVIEVVRYVLVILIRYEDEIQLTLDMELCYIICGVLIVSGPLAKCQLKQQQTSQNPSLSSPAG